MKSLSTYTKYRIGCAYVGEFLQTHYHVKDIALKELSLPFITDYETFLRTDKHLKINSAMVFVRNLRAMVFRAIDNEWLVKDPFRRYEYKEEETTREFLSKEEIHLLMETPITRKKMSMVRDLFLFCCFTGLAFIDLYNLKEENIKEFFDEGEWIVIHRQKTGTEADIKLLDYPKQIMENTVDCVKTVGSFQYPTTKVVWIRSKDWARNAASPSRCPGIQRVTTKSFID